MGILSCRRTQLKSNKRNKIIYQIGGNDPTWEELISQKVQEIIANLEENRALGANWDEIGEEIENVKLARAKLNNITNFYSLLSWMGYFKNRSEELFNFVIENLKDFQFNTEIPHKIYFYQNINRSFERQAKAYLKLKNIHPMIRIFLYKVQELSNSELTTVSTMQKNLDLKQFNVRPDRREHYRELWDHLFDLAELDFDQDQKNDFVLFEDWILKLNNNFPKVYKILYNLRIPLKIAFNTISGGAGNKLFEVVNRIKKLEIERIKALAAPIEAEYQEFWKSRSGQDPEDVKEKFLMSILIPFYQDRASSPSRGRAIFAWLDLDFLDTYTIEDVQNILEGEVNRIANRNLKCENDDDPTTMRDITTFPKDDLIKIWFPNKTQATCYSRNEMLKFMIEPDNIRADWIQNREASVLLNDDQNATGEGGNPGHKRYRQVPGSFKLYIPENSFKLLWESSKRIKEFQLIKFYNVRVGNVSGDRGVSDSHGQDKYPIYKLFIKDSNYTYQNGRYLKGESLGRGSFGSATTVFDTMTSKIMALKVVPMNINYTTIDESGNPIMVSIANPSKQYQAALNEIEIMKKLKLNNQCNKYLVCYQNHFEENEFLHIVMEYLDGCNLFDLSPDQRNLKNHPDILLKFIREVAEAIEFMHTNGVAHKDIHPPNIIYDRRNNRYKLIDFGLSCTSATCPRSNKYNLHFVDENVLKWDDRFMTYQQFVNNYRKDNPDDPELMKNAAVAWNQRKIKEVSQEFDFWKRIDYYAFGLTLVEQLIGKDQFYNLIVKHDIDDFTNKADILENYHESIRKIIIERKNGYVDLSFPEWVTSIALGLLNPNPDRRMTTQQVIDHLNMIEGPLVKYQDPQYPEIFEKVKGRRLCKIPEILDNTPVHSIQADSRRAELSPQLSGITPQATSSNVSSVSRQLQF